MISTYETQTGKKWHLPRNLSTEECAKNSQVKRLVADRYNLTFFKKFN